MTNITQLTTRRYLPDGSPKPHYIATGGKMPKQLGRIYQISVRQGSLSTFYWNPIFWARWSHDGHASDIIAIRWLKKE